MLDYHLLESYDSQGMHKVYDSWPHLARELFEKDYEQIDFKNIDHIIFAGMGGSGSICDVFSSILSKSNIHQYVTKGYVLPKTVDSDTLVIPISISGNTREILSILNLAKKAGSRILAFSSGGKMENYCIKNKINFRKIPQIHSPRASFAPFLYAMLKILAPVIPIKEEDVFESINKLEDMGKQINSSNLTERNPAYNLSQWISEIPLIYYPHGLQSAAVRFKNSLQENAKSHAIVEDVIEACHNNIVAWEKKSNVQPILLRGQNDNPKTKERWEILKEFFETNQINYKEIISVKGNILSKLVSLIYLLDYTTIFLAILSKIDPSPIKSIDFIKNRLDGDAAKID